MLSSPSKSSWARLARHIEPSSLSGWEVPTPAFSCFSLPALCLKNSLSYLYKSRGKYYTTHCFAITIMSQAGSGPRTLTYCHPHLCRHGPAQQDGGAAERSASVVSLSPWVEMPSLPVYFEYFLIRYGLLSVVGKCLPQLSLAFHFQPCVSKTLFRTYTRVVVSITPPTASR